MRHRCVDNQLCCAGFTSLSHIILTGSTYPHFCPQDQCPLSTGRKEHMWISIYGHRKGGTHPTTMRVGTGNQSWRGCLSFSDRTFTTRANSAASAHFFSTVWTAWMTVLWSRLPKCRPMTFNGLLVKRLARNMAIWRGVATSCFRVLPINSSRVRLKWSATTR